MNPNRYHQPRIHLPNFPIGVRLSMISGQSIEDFFKVEGPKKQIGEF